MYLSGERKRKRNSSKYSCFNSIFPIDGSQMTYFNTKQHHKIIISFNILLYFLKVGLIGQILRGMFIPSYTGHKTYSISLLSPFHGLKSAKLFYLISENSHTAIYFIYLIFNKMVQWPSATQRHPEFQSIFRQRHQSVLDLLCREFQLEVRIRQKQSKNESWA